MANSGQASAFLRQFAKRKHLRSVNGFRALLHHAREQRDHDSSFSQADLEAAWEEMGDGLHEALGLILLERHKSGLGETSPRIHNDKRLVGLDNVEAVWHRLGWAEKAGSASASQARPSIGYYVAGALALPSALVLAYLIDPLVASIVGQWGLGDPTLTLNTDSINDAHMARGLIDLALFGVAYVHLAAALCSLLDPVGRPTVKVELANVLLSLALGLFLGGLAGYAASAMSIPNSWGTAIGVGAGVGLLLSYLLAQNLELHIATSTLAVALTLSNLFPQEIAPSSLAWISGSSSDDAQGTDHAETDTGNTVLPGTERGSVRYTEAYVITEARPNERSIAALGDISGDGVPDFATMLPNKKNPGGKYGLTRVYSGADGAVLYDLWEARTSSVFAGGGGFSYNPRMISRLGDVDGDGVNDFVVTNEGTTDLGTAAVISGVDGHELFRVTRDNVTEDPNATVGTAVSGIGDINGDGIPDFAWSDRDGGDPGSNSGPGVVYLMSGADGRKLRTIPNRTGWRYFGSNLARLGDVNDDDVPDFLVAFEEEYIKDSKPRGGVVQVRSGANGSALVTVEDVGASDLAGLGDVDGDGKPDFVVGDRYSFTQSGADGAHLLSGADGKLIATTNVRGRSDPGYAVGRLGDVNDDDIPDFLAGNPSGILSVHVYSGADASELFRFATSDPEGRDSGSNQFFGETVQGIGDINGDGIPDFVVGDDQKDPEDGAGGIHVFTSVR